MVEPQIVFLVSDAHHMTIAIRGVQTMVTRDHDNFEVIQNHDSEEKASREFARWLGRASQEGWDLDPERTPNPAPIDQPYGFEPTPEEERLWRGVSREENDVTIVDLHKLQSRRDTDDVGQAHAHPVWQGVCEQLCAANPTKLHVSGSTRALLEPIEAGGLPALEELRLGSFGNRIYADDHGDLEVVLQATPALKRLEVAGQFSLPGSTHESLEHLRLAADPLPVLVLKELAHSTFPKLRSLALRMSWNEEAEEGTEKALSKLLGAKTFVGLQELELSGDCYPEELLALVAEARPSKLSRLVLPDEFSDVEGAIELLKGQEEKFAGVELVLNTDSWEDEELEYLESAFQHVSYAEWIAPDEDEAEEVDEAASA